MAGSNGPSFSFVNMVKHLWLGGLVAWAPRESQAKIRSSSKEAGVPCVRWPNLDRWADEAHEACTRTLGFSEALHNRMLQDPNLMRLGRDLSYVLSERCVGDRLTMEALSSVAQKSARLNLTVFGGDSVYLDYESTSSLAELESALERTTALIWKKHRIAFVGNNHYDGQVIQRLESWAQDRSLRGDVDVYLEGIPRGVATQEWLDVDYKNAITAPKSKLDRSKKIDSITNIFGIEDPKIVSVISLTRAAFLLDEGVLHGDLIESIRFAQRSPEASRALLQVTSTSDPQVASVLAYLSSLDPQQLRISALNYVDLIAGSFDRQDSLTAHDLRCLSRLPLSARSEKYRRALDKIIIDTRDRIFAETLQKLSMNDDSPRILLITGSAHIAGVRERLYRSDTQAYIPDHSLEGAQEQQSAEL